MKTLISVIVPIHNAEATLSRCLDSLLCQTFHDFELLLVNDGSTDTSSHICHQYAAQHPHIVVIDQENRGVSAARNAGMKVAQGTFITFTDADDEVSPHFLSTFVGLMANHDLCMQSFKQIKPDGHIQSTILAEQTCTTHDEMAQLIITAYKSDMPISACSSLFRRDIIQQHLLQFDERMHVCEDADFILRYLPHCRTLHVTSEAHYTYYSPDSHKTYHEQNALRTSLQLIAATLQLTSNPQLQQELRGLYLDWCIEELLHYTPNQEAHLLASQFAQLCQPYLKESQRPSFRHRLFKHICITSNPKGILLTAKSVMAIYRLLHGLRHAQ